MVTVEDIIGAYEDCAANKRSSGDAIRFGMDIEASLVRLACELNDGSYRHGCSTAFVVRYPRLREVFAAQFRDRVVHHWICMRLRPIIESLLGDRRFNCRKGKGTLYGIMTLHEDMRRESDGYTKDIYVAKGDLKNFFMSIDKEKLATMTDMMIAMHYRGADKEELRRTARHVITFSPGRDCRKRSPQRLFDALAPGKSLLKLGDTTGMPIGNLPSQELANLLLWFALDSTLDELGLTHGGYVDDFYIISANKDALLAAIPKIRESLARYGLEMNERKTQVQHYSKGVQFTGVFLKHGKRYVIPRVCQRFARAAERLEKICDECDAETLEKAVSSVNSYLGLIGKHDSYRLRRRALWRLVGKRRIWVGKDYEKVSIKKECKRDWQIKERVRRANPYSLSLACLGRDDADGGSRERMVAVGQSRGCRYL